ncbi:hypothetical protein PENTCL1PPCAC_6962 [Pristionchus entomophagus]|uniref:Uncharacterized protein n=1 Tax=Pristionchus entomophagus TaxID=358040 RepID=A0AAV5SPS5_9BILA|nr:hypothetical protein PENTCL1PPCAC_6962 [Pristionchus entomophagus]
MSIGCLPSSSIDPFLLVLSLYSLFPFFSILTAMFCCFRPREPQEKSDSCCTTWDTMTSDDFRRDDRTVTDQPSSSSGPTVVSYTPDLSTIKANMEGYQPTVFQETDTTPRVKESPVPKKCTPRSRNLTSRSDDTLIGHPSIVSDHESTIFMATERMDTIREEQSREKIR